MKRKNQPALQNEVTMYGKESKCSGNPHDYGGHIFQTAPPAPTPTSSGPDWSTFNNNVNGGGY